MPSHLPCRAHAAPALLRRYEPWPLEENFANLSALLCLIRTPISVRKDGQLQQCTATKSEQQIDFQQHRKHSRVSGLMPMRTLRASRMSTLLMLFLFSSQAFAFAAPPLEPPLPMLLNHRRLNLGSSAKLLNRVAATMISNSLGVHGAANCIDNSNSNLCTPADADTNNPWLEIDLGASQSVSSLTIYNRVDCCKDRLAAFEVWIGPAAATGGAGTATAAVQRPQQPVGGGVRAAGSGRRVRAPNLRFESHV